MHSDQKEGIQGKLGHGSLDDQTVADPNHALPLIASIGVNGGPHLAKRVSRLQRLGLIGPFGRRIKQRCRPPADVGERRPQVPGELVVPWNV